MMKPNYKLKRTVPREFIVLKAEQYMVVDQNRHYLRVQVSAGRKRKYTMTFQLSKGGNFYINTERQRKNDKGKIITYAIPV